MAAGWGADMRTQKTIAWYFDKLLLCVLLLFFVLHMANHLAIIFGADTHIALMETLRHLYRFPVFEGLLIIAIALQIRAGIRQLRRFPTSKVRGRFRVLTYSGLYLIAFVIIHMSSVFIGRIFMSLDTNLYFAAAGYRTIPASLFFYPYYFTAILAAFAHWGAVVWLRNRAQKPVLANRIYWGAIAIGICAAITITIGISGTLTPFDIPDQYLDTYR
jgi:hypothetical protein